MTEIQQRKLHDKGAKSDERKSGERKKKERKRKERKIERNVILSNSVIRDGPDSPTPQASHREGTVSIPGHSM